MKSHPALAPLRPLAVALVMTLMLAACGGSSDSASSTEVDSAADGLDASSETGNDDEAGATTERVTPPVSEREASSTTSAEVESQTTTTAAAEALPTGIRPVRIEIPSIGVAADMIDLSLAGAIPQVPENFAEVGWYDQTRQPGEIGPAVIAGHIDSTSGPAVFFRLDELAPDDLIILTDEDGQTRTFAVNSAGQYPKENLPNEVFGFGEPEPELRLITCGGVFDRSSGHYRDNYVVYARAVDNDTAETGTDLPQDEAALGLEQVVEPAGLVSEPAELDSPSLPPTTVAASRPPVDPEALEAPVPPSQQDSPAPPEPIAEAQAPTAAAPSEPATPAPAAPTTAGSPRSETSAAPPLAPSPTSTVPRARTSALPKGIHPVRIEIPAIGVDADMIDLSVAGSNPEVPSDFDEVGWYTQSRRPGEIGPAVLAGHINSVRGPAVFQRLSDLTAGDEIFVHGDDGRRRTFVVERAGQYPKGDLPSEVFGFGEARPEMRLITCGGSFDSATRHYRDNFVVYTRLK